MTDAHPAHGDPDQPVTVGVEHIPLVQNIGGATFTAQEILVAARLAIDEASMAGIGDTVTTRFVLDRAKGEVRYDVRVGRDAWMTIMRRAIEVPNG